MLKSCDSVCFWHLLTPFAVFLMFTQISSFLNFSDSFIRGFEVPILVVFTQFMEGQLNDQFFSRCKSKLIIICNEEHAEKIVPISSACGFAKKIDVYGKTKTYSL